MRRKEVRRWSGRRDHQGRTARAGAPTADARRSSCGDQRVPFDGHDIEIDPDGRPDRRRSGTTGTNIIPTIVFPDGSHLAEPSNEELAEKIGLERTAMMHVYDLIIVGGGPAGLTTSIYAARENLADAHDRQQGPRRAGRRHRAPGQLPGVPRGDRRRRARRPDRAAGRSGTASRCCRPCRSAPSRATASRSTSRRRPATTTTRARRSIATGSTYRRTGAGRGRPDRRGDPLLRDVRRPVLQGRGGARGPRRREQRARGGPVPHAVRRQGHDRRAGRPADAANKLLQDKVLMTPKMEVLLNREVVGFRAKDDGSGKLGRDRARGTARPARPRSCTRPAAFVLHRPRPEHRVREGLGGPGRTRADRDGHGLQTSMPGVFAAGDVRSGSTKQLASAVGEGAAAAIGIREYLEAQDSKPVHMM